MNFEKELTKEEMRQYIRLNLGQYDSGSGKTIWQVIQVSTYDFRYGWITHEQDENLVWQKYENTIREIDDVYIQTKHMVTNWKKKAMFEPLPDLPDPQALAFVAWCEKK